MVDEKKPEEKPVLDLDMAFVKLTNPRMTAGLMILHSLLDNLKGEPVGAKEVRESVDKLMSKRKVSKQSITNAAIRLEKDGLLLRGEGKYTVNYGSLVSVLLNTLLEMNERVTNLEDEIELLKVLNRSQ
ncbi:MAG: hypothetical protein RTU63_10560 [Candidatus Thorarchaeota archaeon]